MTPTDEELSQDHEADKHWLRGRRWSIAVILFVTVVLMAIWGL